MGLTVAALLLAYLLGTVPSAHIAARLARGPDLRGVGSGTVSPWNLYREVGPWPALAAGAFDVAKGVLAAALLAGHGWLVALAGALAVVGHNWSPFLRGAGGRGLSTATGALFVVCWPGAAVLCVGLIVGTLVRRVIVVMGLALIALVPVVIVANGPAAAAMVALVVTPIGVKTAALRFRERRRSREQRSDQPG